MSRYLEQIQAIATEEDADRRLELAARLDSDAGELDEKWANRDAYRRSQEELESVRGDLSNAVAERDQWKQRYADRFFDAPSPVKQGEPPATRIGYDNLWD